MMSVPKRRGRKPLCPGEAPVDLHLKLRPAQYDRAWAAAKEDRVTVPEFIRRALDHMLAHEARKAAPENCGT